MLVFIIPLKSKAIARSWPLVCQLLERTLRSVCNQTSPHFRVVVVSNELPQITFEHPALHYVQVDFPPPVLIPQEQEQLKGYEQITGMSIANQDADKCRKLQVGIRYAQRFQPTHLMMMDADDCVSNRLGALVEREPKCDGWVMRKGYVHRENSPFLYTNLYNFNQVSGTSVIIKNELHSLLFKTDVELYSPYFDELPAANIKPLPFIGAIYSIMNGENTLMSASTFSEMKSQIFTNLPKLVQRLTRYRIGILTPAIVKEFGVYNVTQKS